MDASALERAISILETRSDSLESWLLLSIVLVVVGLAVEVFVVVKEHLHPVPSEKRTGWTLLFELIGPVLITIGVGGELGIHVISGSVNTGLRDANKKVVALLNKEAGEARNKAGEANARAGRAEERAGQANERASANEKESARLTKQNLLLQAEVLKLRERTADRHLTPEQQSRIAKSLCKFGGIAVDIGKYSSDGEIEELAKEIKGALPERCDRNPGFEVSFVQSIKTPGFSGIQIIVKEGTSQKSKTFADALATALKQERLQVDGPMPDPTRGRLRLGGSDFSVSVGAGIEQGTPVEIAIGKKP